LTEQLSAGLIVSMQGITKVYEGQVLALEDVDFDLRKGEIHVLLGENGAGKSTLMKILAGALKPTEGRIFVKGREVSFSSPRDAYREGIGMVHQHFTLIPSLNVAENILLGDEKMDFLLHMPKIADTVMKFADRVNLSVDARTPLHTLSVGEKQRVEILKLLYRGADIMIFDEPTSVLGGLEVESFFETLRSLTAQGSSAILVTHKISEAMNIADRLTVLRKGKKIATLTKDEADERKLVELMIGPGEVIPPPPSAERKTGSVVLKIRGLQVFDDLGNLAVRGVNLDLFEGEILGLAGVEGNGQEELVETLVGLRKAHGGTIEYQGARIRNLKPRDLLDLGWAYIPADRLGRGVAPELDVMLNCCMKKLDEVADKFKLINQRNLSELAKKVISMLGVKAPSQKAPVKYLSGGNIQKLIVGREAHLNPKLLIAEQPTAGLDVKTTNLTHSILLEMRNRGASVLLVSTNLDEILKLSDRIAVIYKGEIAGIFSPKDDVGLIGTCMLRGKQG